MTSLPISDPLAAMCAYLGSVESIADLLGRSSSAVGGGPAIYRPDLPKTEDALMPQNCIVVRRVGGLKMFGKSQMPVSDPNMDLLCYGGTRLDSENVATAVVVVLKQLVMQRWANVMLYSANIAAGPIPLPDTQTQWPLTVITAQVMHGDYQYTK